MHPHRGEERGHESFGVLRGAPRLLNGEADIGLAHRTRPRRRLGANIPRVPDDLAAGRVERSRDSAIDAVLAVRCEIDLHEALQGGDAVAGIGRSEEHTSELQSLIRISYAVFGLKKNNSKAH